MKALTVQQPWAWAIIHGGKNIENRTQAWSYRGPLAIHAGARLSERGMQSHLVSDVWDKTANYGLHEADDFFDRGAIIGTVELVDVHEAQPEAHCCESWWAETSYDEHGGRTRRHLVHLVLEHPRPLAEPIPCRGALGLWTPPAEVLDQLHEAAMSG